MKDKINKKIEFMFKSLAETYTSKAKFQETLHQAKANFLSSMYFSFLEL